jgi:hypothetical protein
MAEKIYSLSRAIADVLNRGVPTGVEAEYHFEEMRQREKMPALNFLAGAKGRGQVLHVPLGMLRRDVGVGESGGASLVGQRLERVSDLLSWSSCVAAGAQLLTGLRENVGLARTSKLVEPEWIVEIGFSPVIDPEIFTDGAWAAPTTQRCDCRFQAITYARRRRA